MRGYVVTSRLDIAYYAMSTAAAKMLYAADVVYVVGFICNSSLVSMLALNVEFAGLCVAGMEPLPGFWLLAFGLMTHVVLTKWVQQDEKANVR